MSWHALMLALPVFYGASGLQVSLQMAA